MTVQIGKVIGIGLLLAFGTAAAIADEPPAAATIDPQTVDAGVALEKARELRKRADAGDADAAWEFGRLLAYFNSFGPRADAEHAVDWRELQGSHPVSYWMQHAAELGSQPAIAAVCRMGEDRLAPASLRENSSARCAELRRKFPAN